MAGDDSQIVRMRVKGLMLDPSSKTPIVLLQEADSERFLPIWIGVFEANAIALSLEGLEPPRPMTHDLLHTSLQRLGGEVECVTISGLRDNTFFAEVLLRGPAGQHRIDSRPSDAIALALRAEAPIFVHRTVLDSAQAVEFSSDLSDEEKLKKWLEQAGDDDFGEYKM